MHCKLAPEFASLHALQSCELATLKCKDANSQLCNSNCNPRKITLQIVWPRKIMSFSNIGIKASNDNFLASWTCFLRDRILDTCSRRLRFLKLPYSVIRNEDIELVVVLTSLMLTVLKRNYFYKKNKKSFESSLKS